jgi:hypothetical protein
VFNELCHKKERKFSGNLLKFKLFYCGIREKVSNKKVHHATLPQYYFFPFFP